jgi:hypothetical protein
LSDSVWDLVPIYNARNATGSFQEVLKNLCKLPRYNTDIQPNSCAVIAYTINTWGKQDGGMVNVSFNVQWVMLLGTN